MSGVLEWSPRQVQSRTRQVSYAKRASVGPVLMLDILFQLVERRGPLTRFVRGCERRPGGALAKMSIQNEHKRRGICPT